MSDWRIYYHDGSTFDSTQGVPNDAPPTGVVCIIQFSREMGREILNRWDCYFWDSVEECLNG